MLDAGRGLLGVAWGSWWLHGWLAQTRSGGWRGRQGARGAGAFAPLSGGWRRGGGGLLLAHDSPDESSGGDPPVEARVANDVTRGDGSDAAVAPLACKDPNKAL